MIETDILIIGAGPVGLFTVFEAGLVKLRCHLIDYLPQAGGQLTEIYPKKPIYDIPGYPEVLAGDLVDNLLAQGAPFKPGFTLGERAEIISRLEDGMFEVVTNKSTVHRAPVIAIAGGLGCFEPRKPPIPNINAYEDKGVEYIIRDPEFYAGKRVVISGGGDSALDWAIYLARLTSELTLVHRRREFRGAPDSVDKVLELAAAGRIRLITEAEVVGLQGIDEGSLPNAAQKLQSVTIAHSPDGAKTPTEHTTLEADHFVPLFGLSPKLGPIAGWSLALNKSAITVNTRDYSTNVDGIYAIGDINDYEGKLKLILCGFHEATMMVQSAYKRIHPDTKLTLKYTTVNGVQGF